MLSLTVVLDLDIFDFARWASCYIYFVYGHKIAKLHVKDEVDNTNKRLHA